MGLKHSVYAHCSNLVVNVGDQVKAGDIIATTGTTGLAFWNHLHFGINIQVVMLDLSGWIKNGWMKIFSNCLKIQKCYR